MGGFGAARREKTSSKSRPLGQIYIIVAPSNYCGQGCAERNPSCQIQ